MQCSPKGALTRLTKGRDALPHAWGPSNLFRRLTNLVYYKSQALPVG